MKKITLLMYMLFVSYLGWTQVYVEEDFSTGALPVGWTNNDILGDGAVWQFDNPGDRTINLPMSEPVAIIDSDDYGADFSQNAALETLVFDASSATAVELKFDYYFRNYSFGDSQAYVEVFNGTDWVEVFNYSGSNSPNPDEAIIDISDEVVGVNNAQVRFRYVGDYDYYWIIDNIYIGPPPTCPDPADIAVSEVTYNSVELSWTIGSDETEWTIAYGVPGFDPNTDGDTLIDDDGEAGATLENLTPGADYEVYIKAICGEGDESEWVGPIAFTTVPINDACIDAIEVSTFPYTNSQNASAATNNDGFINVEDCGGANDGVWYAITGDGGEITINLTETSSWDSEIGVFTGTCGDFTCVGNVDTSSETETITFLTGVGTTYYVNIAQYSSSTNNAEGSLDLEITTTGLITCPDPVDIAVSEVTYNSVELSWTIGSDETEWTIAYGVPGFDPNTDGDTLTDDDGETGATLENLTPETDYEVYIKAICGEGDESEWVGPIAFTTVPINDACIDAIEVSTFPYTNSQNASAATNNDGFINVEDCGGANDGVWYAITGDGGEITLNLTETSSWDSEIGVFTGTCGDFTCVGNVDTSSDTETITFLAGVGTTYYVNIAQYSDSTNNAEGSFDLEITTTGLIACPYPADIVFENIFSDAAELVWTENGEATEWEIIYGETGFDIESEGTIVTDNDGALGEIVSGLTPETEYDVYVRAVCGEDDESEWVGPVSFTTPAPPIEQECGDTFLDSGGVDESYSNNEFITTTITPDTTGDVVTITFTMVDIEAGGASGTNGCYDFLTIYNGPDTSYPVLAETLCGEESGDGDTPNMDTSLLSVGDSFTSTDTSGALTIVFTSDTGTIEPGWEANITCGPPPTCLDPSTIIVNNMTADSAEISWTAGDVETEWEIEYGEAGFEQGTGTVIADNDGTLGETISDLTANTEYEVYVRAICGVDNESVWAGPLTFMTDCAVITTFPYTEDFDGATTPDLPSCWSYLDENGDDDFWITYVTYGIDGTQAAGLYTDFNDGANNDYLISPQFTLTGNEQLRFSVRARSTFEPNDFKVMLSTSGNDAASFTEELLPLTTISSTEYEQYTINLDDYTGDVYIAFHVPADGLDGYYLYVDNFVVRTIPTCPEPIDLSAVGTGTTTGDVDWTAGGDETEWTIAYGAPGFDPDGTDVDTVTDDDSEAGTTLTDLNPQTEYEVYVKAVCGEGDESVWTGPVTFMTDCIAVTTFPYTEDFDGATTPDLPSCWSYLDENGDDDFWITYVTYGIDGTQAAGLYTDFNSGANNDYLISPQFTLTGNEQLRFSVRARSTFEPNDFKVMLSTSGDDAASFTEELLPLTTISSTEYEQYTINLDDYTGDVYIAFHVPADGLDGYYLYVDNFVVRTIPTCPEPTDILVENLGSTADVSWTAGGDETEWEIKYGISGFDPEEEGTSIIDNDGTLGETLSELTLETEYDVYVKAICGEGDESVWIGPVSFYSWYCESVPTSNDNSGITNVQIMETDFPNEDVTYASFTGTTVDIYQDILTNIQISFATDFDYDTHIWIDFNDDFIFDESELVYSGVSEDLPATILDASFTLLADTSLGTHAMRIGTADSGQATPDPCYSGAYGVTLDFMVNILPGPCPAPSDITVDPSDDLANVTWTENGDATAWTVIYGPVGFDPEEEEGTQVTVNETPEVTLEGLEQETQYEVYVMSDCEIGAIWIGPVIFETIPNTCLAPTDIQINQIVGPTAQVTWVENGTATAWEVEYGLEDFEPGTGTIVEDNDGTLGVILESLDQEVEYDVYVRAICDGDGMSDWTGPTSFISDVSCPIPSDISITGNSGDSVDVSWTENGLATEWEIEYGSIGFTLGEGTTVMDTDGEIGTTLTGLDVNTDYDLYMRSICGGEGNSDWFGPINFTTATTGLIAQSFENFVFYPNPTENELHLQATRTIEEVVIYNLLGQKVLVEKPNLMKPDMDVTRLQAGAYLLKVTIDGYVKTFKLVKE